jgi:hypothetical protein
MKRLLAFAAVFLFCFSCFAENEISDYTLSKILDFVTLRVQLKSIEDSQEVLDVINSLQEKVFEELPSQAKDYEQEKQILSNLYFMEGYVRRLTKSNYASLRKEMKNQMNDCHKLMEKRSEKNLSKWFYVTTADVTSYYMTRSLAASFYWGFKVKDWHKKALKKDEYMTAANACLANWNFYAPAPIGSNKKARQYYKNGLKGARTLGEKYMIFTYYSQFLYEEKEYAKAAEYLEMAYELDLGTKELDLMKKCNEEGYSYLQYMRDKSGIDEEIPKEEREAED